LPNRGTPRGAARARPNRRCGNGFPAIVWGLQQPHSFRRSALRARPPRRDGVRTAYLEGTAYLPYGLAVVTLKQLRSVRAYYAGTLCWSAANAFVILLMGALPEAGAAPAPAPAPKAAEPEPAAAEEVAAAPEAATDVEAAATA
jgi:hypothetical protein